MLAPQQIEPASSIRLQLLFVSIFFLCFLIVLPEPSVVLLKTEAASTSMSPELLNAITKAYQLKTGESQLPSNPNTMVSWTVAGQANLNMAIHRTYQNRDAHCIMFNRYLHSNYGTEEKMPLSDVFAVIQDVWGAENNGRMPPIRPRRQRSTQ